MRAGRNYTSQARFAAELDRVFRRTPTPFYPSAALPETGSYVARDAALTPIIAMRGADGMVRAFRNACRTAACNWPTASGCKKALTCRYHAWTYGLDGRLRGIPDEHGFPGIDKSAHGLVPVTRWSKHGMVFVTQDEAGGASAAGGRKRRVASRTVARRHETFTTLRRSSRQTGRSSRRDFSRAITSARPTRKASIRCSMTI